LRYNTIATRPIYNQKAIPGPVRFSVAAAKTGSACDTPWLGCGFFRRARDSMPDDPLHQPHDKLFRATFSDPRNAAAFLRHHLEAPLPALVDWNSLVLLPSSFIDARMAGPEADLLFSAKFGGSDALLYILWEHQRRDAPLMGLRLLSYMVLIWKSQVRESGPSARLAPIHPLALAQDKDHWKTSTHFPDLFGFPPDEWRAARGAVSHPMLPRLRPGHSLRRTPKLYPQSALGLKVKRWVVGSDGSGVFRRILAVGPGSRYAEFSASAISSSVMDRLGNRR
jgi:hypothetical protein